MSWRAYAGKILKRCAICGSFGASYRVEETVRGSVRVLCERCWRAIEAPKPGAAPTDPPPDGNSG